MSPVFIRHRVNRIAEVAGLRPEWGAEIDLRSDLRSGSIHLSHDAFKAGDGIEPWLDAYRRQGCTGPLILNTKEDGLESKTIDLLRRHGIENYFFLDTTLPTLVRWMKQGENRFAVRVSEYEPAPAVSAFAGRLRWAWVDCFGAKPITSQDLEAIKGKFHVCLVSPELQGGSVADLPKFSSLANSAEAICTKDPAAWSSILAL